MEKQKALDGQSNSELKEYCYMVATIRFKLYIRAMTTISHDTGKKMDMKIHGAEQRTHWRKDILNKWFWGDWIFTCRKMRLVFYISPYTKINYKWIKDLNLRSKL